MIKPYICFNFYKCIDNERIASYRRNYFENVDDIFKYYENCLEDMKLRYGTEGTATNSGSIHIDFCCMDYNEITGDILHPHQEWCEGQLKRILNKQPVNIIFHYHNLNDIFNDKLMLTQMFENFRNNYLNKEN